MTDYVKLARERVNRAWEHIQEFKTLCDAFLATKPYSVVTEVEPHSNFKHLRFVFKVREQPPIPMRVVVGEGVYQLRAALDNLVWGLGQLNGEPARSDLAFELWDTERSADPKVRSFEACYLPKLKRLPREGQDLHRRHICDRPPRPQVYG